MNEEKEKERRLGFGVSWANDDWELGSSTETPVGGAWKQRTPARLGTLG